MSRWAILALVLLLPGASAAQSPSDTVPVQSPRQARERVVLRTVAGDVVLALYPDVAPAHVEQFLKLVKLGCYDTAHFSRVDPNFVVQLCDLGQRRLPLSEQQRSAIHPLEGEFSKTVLHRRGSLSMARRPEDPDSAETSFSVLLVDSPHLDGQYTLFGHVESGMDVFERMVEVLREPPPSNSPIVPLEVLQAEVVPVERLPQVKLTPAHPVHIPANVLAEYAQRMVRSTLVLVVSGLVVIVVVALVGVAAGPWLPKGWHLSLYLLILLVVVFLLLAILTPWVQGHSLLAAGLFLAVVGVFRLLSNFESAG